MDQFSNKFRAKKSFGQNFLKSTAAISKIIEAGEINSSDVILEIGPGKGVLTEKLLGAGGKVIAIEKDRELYEFLSEKFKEKIESGNLALENTDILKFNSEKIGKGYKIIANIPYNITGAILKKFLSAKNQPERMVLMVQQEVAERIMARNGKESILSVSVKAYGEPKIITKVSKRYFSPMPRVDSAVIAIKNISRENFEKNKVNEEKFWEIVKKGFAHKRKKLGGNLKSSTFFKKNPASPLREMRAENLGLKDWIFIAKNS